MSDAAAREQTSTETGAERLGLRAPFSEDVKPPPPETGTPPQAARRRLARLVAVKLALDLVFVAALAVYAYADTFREHFDGALEHADGRGVRGWVLDETRPGAAVEVQLFIDGRFHAALVADRPAAELLAGGADDGRRGFAFVFDAPLEGEHEARVYAVRAGRGGERRTLRQIGEARRFAWR